MTTDEANKIIAETVWSDALRTECQNDKGVVYCKMSAEAQRAMVAARVCRETDQLDFDGKWKHAGYDDNPYKATAYRIRPDWTPPEPKPATKLVRVVPIAGPIGCSIYTPNGSRVYLTEAPNVPGFRGYEYAGMPIQRRPIFDGVEVDGVFCRKLRIPDAVLFEVAT